MVLFLNPGKIEREGNSNFQYLWCVLTSNLVKVLNSVKKKNK